MAGKAKFRIPTGKEMEDTGSDVQSVNPMTLFSAYKQQKTTAKDTPRQVSTLVTYRDATSTEEAKRNQSSSKHLRNGVSVAVADGSSRQIKQQVPSKATASYSSGEITKSKPAQGVNSDLGKTSRAGGDTVKDILPKPTSLSSSSSSTSTESGEKLPTQIELESVALKAGSTTSIIVNPRQRGNPILKHVRNVPWEFGSIMPDYVMGRTNCALFLSLRYHQLNPTYIHNRLKELGRAYDLRVLLVQVDIKEPHHLLKELAKICILAECTLILAFTPEEAGRYLEAYKVYENKPPDAIMEKVDSDFMSKFTDCLTTVKSVNKTDCMTLLSTFGSMENVIEASAEDLSLCPGFGPQKAKRLHDVFHEPFLKVNKRKLATDSKNTEAASSSKSKR